MPKNINSVSHLTCCCPPFPDKSVVTQRNLAGCAALCPWVLLAMGQVPRKGGRSPVPGWLQGGCHPPAVQSPSLHQHSPNRFLIVVFAFWAKE